MDHRVQFCGTIVIIHEVPDLQREKKIFSDTLYLSWKQLFVFVEISYAITFTGFLQTIVITFVPICCLPFC